MISVYRVDEYGEKRVFRHFLVRFYALIHYLCHILLETNLLEYKYKASFQYTEA